MDYTEEDYNFLSQQIIKSAIEVHKELGPGLYESIYEMCLIKALKDNGLEPGKRLGLLINFNEELLKDGIRRRVNGTLNHTISRKITL